MPPHTGGEIEAEGAVDEVESIYRIFLQFMADGFPPEELEVVDSVLRMFTEPCLRADVPLLRKVWMDEAQAKATRLANLGVSASELASADRFAELLREEGEEPETKTSAKGNEVYAFAKTDDYMRGGVEEVWLKQITPKQFSDKVNDIFQQEMKDGVVKKPPPRG